MENVVPKRDFKTAFRHYQENPTFPWISTKTAKQNVTRSAFLKEQVIKQLINLNRQIECGFC